MTFRINRPRPLSGSSSLEGLRNGHDIDKEGHNVTNVAYNNKSNIINNKIYIGNLDYTLGNDDLKGMFSEFGDITDVVIIKDKESGCSRGFGFVTFNGNDSAKAALAMHGQELNGRPMRVKIAEAKPRTQFQYQEDEFIF